MKHRRIFSLITAGMVVLSLAGCGNESEVPTLETEEAFVTEIETETEQTSRSETEQTSETESSGTTTALSETETEVLSTDEILTEETNAEETISATQESDSPIWESREYELNLTEYLKRDKYGIYSLRDELSFLDDEQYEVYLRAWILVDGIEEFFWIPCTTGETHYLSKDGEIWEKYYYEFIGCAEYSYVSTYESFYSYLQTVFTQEGVDEIFEKYENFFLIVDDELYMLYGEKGGPAGYDGGEYKLIEISDDAIEFEYIAYYDFDGEKWTITNPIKMINTPDGWRCELFGDLRKLN